MFNQENILNSINKNNSYIISGINGCGKTTIAYKIVEKCIDKKYLHTFPTNYPDFHFLSGGKVEEVQLLLKTLQLKPFYDKHYVILDKLDKMTKEAQNTLLKILEESDVMFVLTSNNDSRILKTIFSRCYKISPNLLSQDEIKNILFEKFPLEKEEYLNIISNLCSGSLGKAYKYVENETLKNLILDLSNLKSFNFLEISSKYENFKDEKDDIICIIEQFIRNKMYVSNKELKTKYFDLTFKICEYKQHLFQNGNVKMIYRNIFMELINLEQQ